MPGTPRSAHSDLRGALLAEAVEQARVGGPDAIGLREAQRRLGVSPTAAYRHYGGRADLVAAVSAHAAAALARRMRDQQAAVPRRRTAVLTARARFRATGQAYLDFALDEPGLFRTLFTAQTDDGRDDHGKPAGLLAKPDRPSEDPDAEPFAVLGAALDDLAAAGGLRDRRQPWTDITAWSAVHGLAVLLLDGPLRLLPAADRHAAVDQLLNTIDSGIR